MSMWMELAASQPIRNSYVDMVLSKNKPAAINSNLQQLCDPTATEGEHVA